MVKAEGGIAEMCIRDRGKWLRRTAKDRQFFGGSYLVAERKGASVSFVFPDVAEGRYEVFKWIPGPLDKKFAREENRWQPIGEVVQEDVYKRQVINIITSAISIAMLA